MDVRLLGFLKVFASTAKDRFPRWPRQVGTDLLPVVCFREVFANRTLDLRLLSLIVILSKLTQSLLTSLE